ncbi:hypothetical protein ABWH93_12720 [Seohaeicola saemankumensis]|uniref:hypothetical protein n=1 Tax=Seohaeicola TaxID=481178 RepID=UPI0035D0BDCD
MKRVIMTAVTAAMFGSIAIADGSAPDKAIGTRSEPAFVHVDERDRGINGKVTVYVFGRHFGQSDHTFPQR